MNDNQLKVIGWIKSGMGFAKGVDLLVDLTRKQTFYNLFSGKDKSLPDKLAYEICKAELLADHITWKAFFREVQKRTKKEFDEKGIDASVKRAALTIRNIYSKRSERASFFVNIFLLQ